MFGKYLCLVLLVSMTLACQETSPVTESAAKPDAATPKAEVQKDKPLQGELRLVSLGGSQTETLFALGVGDKVVGIDTSSTYPPQSQALPKVGHHRQISAESILALRPSHVLAGPGVGPAQALTQLREAGVVVNVSDAAETVEAARAKIKALGDLTGKQKAASSLLAALDKDLEKVKAAKASMKTPPRAVFVYARGMKTLLVSGKGTAAHTMLTLAGADNSMAEVDGFKPLTPEALLKADPEVVVIPSHGLESLGGEDGLWKLPGLATTSAGKRKRYIAIDDALLLNFGPRLGEAALLLQAQLIKGQGAP